MVVSFCTRSLLLPRRKLFRTPTRKHGYTVLLPQFGENMVKRNLLIKDDKTPEFNNATIEKCVAAIFKQCMEMEEKLKEMEAALKGNPNLHLFRDIIDPLEEAYVPLELTHGIAQALYYGNQGLILADTYQKVHKQAEAALHKRFNNPFIYEACLKAKKQKDPTRVPEEERVIDKYLMENTLNGAGLNARNREKLKNYQELLRKHSYELYEKILSLTIQYSLRIDNPKIVESFPEDLLQRISSNPEKCHIGPWKVTLDSSTYELFMKYCPDGALRAQIWNAYVSRGSQHGDRAYRTSATVEQIRQSKQDVAHILGFPTYVEYSMQTKMAGSKKNILDTFDVLLEKAYPAQEREIANLTEFRGMPGEWKESDLPFYITKQRQALFPYDSKNLHNYFPLRKVLSGLFQLVEDLYDIKIVESRKVDIWHKDVRYFEIFEGNNLSEPISGFYLDPYNPAKNTTNLLNEEAASIIISKKSKIGKTKPILALIFRFQKPNKEKPCLLTFYDVNVLFEKFGHIMACLLNKGERADVSGHSYLEWDAAHIGNHLMINWLYEPWVMKQVSGHYDTNNPVPDETIKALRNIRDHFGGFYLCQKMYWSQLDLELFSTDVFWPKLVRNMWSKYFVIPQPLQDERLLSNIDIMSRWSAAYFSTLWSEMLAADIFSAFKEIPAGNTDQLKQMGKRYRDTFLALTGSYPTSEIFRRFHGRDPSPKALLKRFEINDVTLEHAKE